MGRNPETRRYVIHLLHARGGVSVYSRLLIGRWDHLHLGVTILGTALALYFLVVCLSLLLAKETFLPTAVFALGYSYLNLMLLLWKDTKSHGSYPSTTADADLEISRSKVFMSHSLQKTSTAIDCQSHVHASQFCKIALDIVSAVMDLSRLLLLAGDVETNPGPQTAADGIKLTEKDLATLTDALRGAVIKWRAIGLDLGWENYELDIIEHKPLLFQEGPAAFFRGQWLKWAPPNHPWPTLGALASALMKTGEEKLAFELKEQYCKGDSDDLLAVVVSSSASPTADLNSTARPPSNLKTKEDGKCDKGLNMPLGASPSATNSDLPLCRYAEYLKLKYACKTRVEDDKRQYPSRKAAKYINLAIIRSDKVDKRRQEKVVQATIHGTISDVTNEMGSLELDQIRRLEDGSLARCVLVQGAPGIGKTTMAWELCRRWGEGEILPEFTLLVLLKLRDRCVQEATTIVDLISHADHSLRSAVASLITRNNGRQTLFLLEGYDELPQDLQENSIFAEIIDGNVLPEAGVIVTSRPTTTDTLYKRCSGQVCQHVEVLGFTEEQINSYVKASFGDEHHQHEFESYLTCYPHIAALMSIPVNCSIVIDVYLSSKSTSESIVPRTQTELYSALTRIVLGRHLTANKVLGKKWNLQSMADLPSNVELDLLKLSEVAYTGIIQQQLVFHTIPSDLETMGFMKQEYDEQGSISYNFLHLTVQEFLAAYHVSKLPLPKQAQILDVSIGKKHLVIMMRFIAGLTNFHVVNEQSSDRSFSVQVSKFFKGLFKSRDPADCLRSMYYGSKGNRMESLRWIFETQAKVLLTLAFGTEMQVLELSYQTLTPFDCYVIANCINNSDCRWRLNFRWCHITETCIKMMVSQTGNCFSRVKAADLTNNPLETGGVHLFASALRKNIILNKLELFNCHIDAEGTSQLAEALCGIKILRELNLSLNTVDTQGARHLASALRNNTMLTELGLSSCHIDAEGTSQLAEALCGINTLRKLELSDNTVDTQGARHLAILLRRTHSLTLLRLNFCGIGEDAACQLAEGIRANSTLTWLWLLDNPLGQKGAQALVDSLAHNTSVGLLLPIGYKETIKTSVVYSRVSSRIALS